MYAISALYTEYLNKRNRDWLVKANIAGTDYGSNVIVDFEIENSLVLSEEFEIGTAILSKLTIRLKTSAVIAPNVKVIPYVALQLPPSLDGANVAWQDNTDAWQDAAYPWQGGVTEWLSLGEFYIDNREQIKDIWVYTCYDKLIYADVPYVSTLTYPTTQQAVWNEICTSLGYIYDSSVVIDPAYMIQAGPAGYSKRQVLGYIASANSASVYIGKDGIVRFRKFAATDTEVFEMTDAKYIRAKQTNPKKTYTRIVVTYNTEDQLTYGAGTGDENHTLYIENPFATQTITNDLLTKLNGFSYIPVEMDARGYPQIEAGDRLRFGVYVSTPAWQDANTAWNATDYSWDGYSSGGHTNAMHTVYSFKGGLKMSIEAQSKSDQQSEFVIEGTLSAQINKLNLLAVRENKSYFGMTVTRTQGLTIEREDHFSKAIFNSDEFAMKVGDGLGGYTDAVYFDPILKKYKFNGTLEAADGIFSGALSAATGTFTGALQGGTIAIGSGNIIFKADSNGIYLGHALFASAPFRVNMTGHMIAVGGEFSGEITASIITGGQINGSTITGALIQTAAPGIYPRVELSTTNNLIAVYADANTFLSINPIGFGSVPALSLVAAGTTKGFLNRSVGGTTLGTFDGEDLNLQASGNLQIGGVNGITGTVYVSATSGGPTTIPITFTKGIRTG